ncbi:MAG TPA: sugar ABC transporter substrate-binding protein [Bauldia sp.]|nr:sugar ABC transporter substrate-binding protein [Bauldia sp.]
MPRIRTMTALGILALAAPAHAEDALQFTFVHPSNTSNVFYQAVQKGMSDACAQVGAECQMLYVQNEMDIQQELANLETAIAQDVDGIMATIVNDDAYDELVKRAIDAGIPVIAVTTDDSKGAEGNARLSFIGQNVGAAGYALAKDVATLFPAEGPIHVLLGVSAPGQNWAEARIAGIEKYLGEYKDANPGRVVTWERIDSGLDLAVTGARVAAYLQQRPDTTAYFDAGFWEAGAAVALKDLGFEPGQIILAGFDTVPQALEQMKAGYIQRVVDQQPYLQGYLSAIQLYLINTYGLSGWDVDTGKAIVTPEAVDQIMDLSLKGIR